MTTFIAPLLAYIMGVVTGVVFVLSIACRSMRKDKNVTGPIIKETEEEPSFI